MKPIKSFLGRGWKFPPTFDEHKMSVVMVSEEEDIRESLFILLSTQPGERTFNSRFGCELKSLLFEPLSGENVSYIEKIIYRAVNIFEPRIDLESVKIETDQYLEGRLFIHLEYIVRQTNARNNLVYPFYLLEGTEIRELPTNASR